MDDSKSLKGSTSGQQLRRRPEMPLYRPGMGRVLANKRPDSGGGGDQPITHNTKQEVISSGDESHSRSHEVVNQEFKPTSDPNGDQKSNNSNNKGVNSKKPDIKVYVPPKLSTGQTSATTTAPTTAPAIANPTPAPVAIDSKPITIPNERPVSNVTAAVLPDKQQPKVARSGVQSNDNNSNSNHSNNSRRQQPNRNTRREKSDRNDRQQQHSQHDNRVADSRHEKSSKSDNRRQRHSNASERPSGDRPDRHERSERTAPSVQKPSQKTAGDRNHGESRNQSVNQESTKNQSNELADNYGHKDDGRSHRRSKRQQQNEPKLDHRLPDRHHQLDKDEDYEDYYNVDFNPITAVKMDRNYKFSANINQNYGNTSHSSQRISVPTVPEVTVAANIVRNDGNFTVNSSDNNQKYRPKHEPIPTPTATTTQNKRNFTANKTQHNHRYTKQFEHQIPPRFLKQQQLRKQNELSEQQQVHYDSQRSNSLPDQPPQPPTPMATVPESVPHRGLIRLPSNQVSANEWTTAPQPPQQPNASHGQHRSATNASKPCVAIRPTQHVSASSSAYSVTDTPMQQYSPSSSPDTNSLNATVDNYQQLSPYLRSNNYNEYAIPHFMSAASVENPENSRRKLKPIIEKSLSEAASAESDLALCHDQQKVEQLRYRIQLRYEHIILNDLRFCAETNVEQRLWKSAFYQFIEHYRRLMDSHTPGGGGGGGRNDASTTPAIGSEQKAELKTSLHKIIDEASLFFENLLVKMQETYGFVIEKLLAHEYDSDHENYETFKLASISAQKIYLYLGDLSRYRECETKNSTFVKSKFFYLRAQMLAPKNGRSYNQLALLAMYQNRRLDAVYYYMRSLAASNPFLTARENLLAIFDECRRKYELNEKKRNQDLEAIRRKRREELDSLAVDKNRLEIWIRPDGSSAVVSNIKQLFETDSESAKENLGLLSSVDLNKRFVLSFLHTHGKLFSRVGMESFVPVVNQMLAEFQSLLRRSPIPVMSQRLSQLLAINMFAVFHTSLKDPTYGQNCRSLMQEQAIQVTFAMMSLILECAINTLAAQKTSEPNSGIISDDLSELLPTIKLWTDWMSCQKQLWCPPPPPSDFKINCREDGDIWTLFAEFLTLLTKINIKTVKLFGSKLEGCEPIILPEDTSLAGFLPLLGSPQCVQFAQPNYDKEKARTCLRLTAIQYFGDYLCGIVEPYLKYDVENQRFVSLIPTLITPTADSPNDMINKSLNELDIGETENDEYSCELSSVETNNTLNSDSNESVVKSPKQMEIEKLWLLQERLKKDKDTQDLMKQTVNDVLYEENQSKPRIVIQPRYVVPDTNCYIDHLDKIKRIIHSKYYELIVPLIVINELNGLKTRGICTTKPLTFSADHIGNVAKSAMEAMDYLTLAFNDKSLKLKAITSKGSIMESINFISESITDTQGNTNDDFILNACFYFIKDKPKDKSTKESAMTTTDESNSIFREVVLLTDDRNLRVKALGHNVPVRGLKPFVKWAAISLAAADRSVTQNPKHK